MSANFNDVMMAILSMDAYNEGDDKGMQLPDNAVTVGGAAIINYSDPGQEKNYSFSATAYSWQGETIVAYRGTDYGGSIPIPDRRPRPRRA